MAPLMIVAGLALGFILAMSIASAAPPYPPVPPAKRLVSITFTT